MKIDGDIDEDSLVNYVKHIEVTVDE